MTEIRESTSFAMSLGSPPPSFRPRRVPTATAVVLLAALALAGCAVTPDPLTAEDHVQRAAADLDTLYGPQEALTRPVGLYDAMARALTYNLDHRVVLMEEAVRNGQADLAHLDLLPRLALSAGYLHRSAEEGFKTQNDDGSFGQVVTGKRGSEAADLTLSWNVLDFGVSYFQARQNANRQLVMAEDRRKAANVLLSQVRAAWWKAATAERLAPQVEPVLALAHDALAAARAGGGVDDLKAQKELLVLMRRLEDVRDGAALAKAELAALMYLDPKRGFQLALAESSAPEPPLTMAPDDMEKVALVQRPELVAEGYQSRITADEPRKALLRLLPGLEVFSGGRYDSSDAVLHQAYAQAGVKVTWNLMRLATGGDTLRQADAQMDLVNTRRLAVSMAVISQVRLAWLEYQRARGQYAHTQAIDDLGQRIRAAVDQGRRAGGRGLLDSVRAAADALDGQRDRDAARAELDVARARIFATLGLDPVPSTAETRDLSALAQGLETVAAGWAAGDVAVPAFPARAAAAPPAEAAPVLASVAAAPVVERAAAAPPPSVAAVQYVVAAGIYAFQDNAKIIAARLRKMKLPVTATVARYQDKGMMHVLWVGPFPSRDAALAQLAKVRKAGVPDARVMERQG